MMVSVWYIFSHMKDFLKVVVYGGLFAVPFLTMYVVNDYFFPFITGKNFAFRIIVEITFVAWGLLMLVEAKYRPKFSWLLSSFALLIIVMFFANLFGQDPNTAFWSNFERMDGYITLIHVFLYTVVLGSVLTTKSQWGTFLHTTLGVAFITAMYGLAQFSGMGDTAGEGQRIESFLGNAAYMAIYMYFHIFIAFWLFVESRSTVLRTIYGLLAFMFIYTLIETGTRGTALGLLAGGFVMVAYMALFGSKYPQFRKYAVVTFFILLVGAGTMFTFRNSDFVQSNPNIARVTDINLSRDLEVRGTIWSMAWEGVKERPILGWGQGNFNYVFNEQYDPFLYNQEQWFDRTHNIVLDWLIAGGFLGFFAYMGIFVACIYYLLVLPWRKPEDQTFTVLERGVLLGILAGYMTHNLVVFDNIISYIFFAVILALIHSRVGEPLPMLNKLSVDKQLLNQFLVPLGIVVVVALIYTMHLPGMRAASDIISAYRTEQPEERLEAFKQALERDSFANQEVVEQVSQQAMGIFREEKVPTEVKEQFVTLAEAELMKLAKEKPGDARVHVFFSSFYRGVNNLEGAEAQIKIAHELSPRKPSILMQYAIIKYSQGDLESAKGLFKQAYDLDHRNDDALSYYAALLFATGAGEEAKALVSDERILGVYAMNDFVLAEVNKSGDTEFLRTLYTSRVEQQPTVAQNWASLSFLLYQAKMNEEAIAVLERASEAVPTFKKTAQCFITNIKAGKTPEEGCGK